MSLFRKRTICFGLAIIGLALTNIIYSAPLPELGSPSRTSLSAHEEKVLGLKFMNSLRAQLDINQDPIITGYVNQIGQHLLTSSGHKPKDFYFFVVDDGDINAFAGPGGYIGINTGTVLAAHSPDELASVMAHEIAHVTQQHIARSLAASHRNMVPLLASILVAAAVGGQAGVGVASAGIAGVTSNMLHFSRDNEQEADRVGMQLLYQAGYQPAAMPKFFARMQHDARFDTDLPAFLSTHPVTQSRIADSLNRANQYVVKTTHADPNFRYIQALLKVKQANDPSGLLNQLQAKRRLQAKAAVLNYSYALTLAALHHFAEAKTILLNLINKHPNISVLKLSLAELETQNNQAQAAVNLLQANAKPQQFAWQVLMARALNQAQHYTRASKIYSAVLRTQPKRLWLYQEAARNLADADELAQAYLLKAKAAFGAGDKKRAQQLLVIAKRLPKLKQADLADINLFIQKMERTHWLK